MNGKNEYNIIDISWLCKIRPSDYGYIFCVYVRVNLMLTVTRNAVETQLRHKQNKTKKQTKIPRQMTLDHKKKNKLAGTNGQDHHHLIRCALLRPWRPQWAVTCSSDSPGRVFLTPFVIGARCRPRPPSCLGSAAVDGNIISLFTLNTPVTSNIRRLCAGNTLLPSIG